MRACRQMRQFAPLIDMNAQYRIKPILLLTFSLLVALIVSACNLSSSPQGEEELTQEATSSIPPTRTPAGTLNVPTTLPLTSIAPTRIGGSVFVPTSVFGQPTAVLPPPVNNPQTTPVSIVILSPVPGNVVAGNVQVLGSAIHPQFLQYQLEYGPDPNPSNLWFPATGAIQSPVLNNLLGIWGTGNVPDGTYQLRLRVYLRDATSLTTVVNNIRVQNRVATPQPSATPNVPRPIAAFTQDKSSGQTPLRVRFTNQSTGNASNFLWNFGDGQQSTDRDPNHTYNSPGLYTVTLSVSGPGGSSNVSSQINVQSPTAPVAGFTSEKTNGPSPLFVQFTDQSTGNITGWNWNFSDGTGSTDRNPQHRFDVPGTYNVFLTVSGPGGSSSARREITVQGPTITPPATLTSTVVPPATATPTSTATATTAPTATSTATATATQPTAPTANFSSAPNGSLTIQYTDASTSASGGITGWTWDFGDNTTSNEQNPSHTYGTGGNYTVTLTVSDAGGTNSTSQIIGVEQPAVPPSANFTYAPNGNLTIQFTDASSSTNGGITGWTWNFGDNTSSSEQNPSHTYSSAGDYTVTLTVSDAGGTSQPVSQTVNVAQPAVPPSANFTFAPAGDLTIQFADASNSSSGGITGWTWDFGDNTSSNEQNPTHTYNAPGDYTVELIVSDAGGQSQPSSQTVNVAAPASPPTANFSTAPAGDLTVQFTDASNSSNGGITGWTWNFGDNTTSNEQNPTHTYNAPGDYTVELIVSDAGGQSQPAQQTVNVAAPQGQQNNGQPSVTEQTGVIPNINADNLRNNLQSIYQNGQNQGNRAGVFSIAGDRTITNNAFLDPFGNGNFSLDDSTQYLQGIIDWYNLTDLGGNTSFNRNGLAVNDDWKVGDLIDPSKRDTNACNDGESPLACELRVNQPAVVIIGIGYNDVTSGTNIDDFRNQLGQAIQTAIDHGVMPVVMTVRPRPDVWQQTLNYNDAIIEVANNYNVPVYNQWGSLNNLPNVGLTGDNSGLSESPGGPGDLSSGAVNNYGQNARNRDVLTILDTIRNTIFPGATAP
jgi:PKD repeat protein